MKKDGDERTMTEKEFWMKLDQVAESKKYTDPVERVKDMAVLLTEAYFADFLFHLGYLKDTGGELKPASVLYRFGEEEQGQVSVIACFSSPRTAKTAPEKIIVRKTRIREVINEILKKKHIPGIVVNPYTDRVVIPRVIFEKIILESERIED